MVIFMAEKKQLRAAIYTRVSRDFTGKHRAVERQEEDCRIMCDVNNYKLVGVFSDNSISAYSGAERPQYERMLREYKRGKIDVIVAWKLDRLTRSVKGFNDMIDEVQKQGLRICTTDLGEVDMADAGSEFVTNMLVNVAQFESRRKSERAKRANKQRAQMGYIKGGTRCFGFAPDLTVVEEEADCIRKMYAAYAAGATMSAIARNIAGESDTLGLPHFDAPSVIFARERWERMSEEERQQLSPRQIQLLPRELYEQVPKALIESFSAKDRKAIKEAQAKPEKKFDLPVTQQILRNPRYAGYVCYVPTVNGKCQSTNARWTDFIVRDEGGEPVKAAWPAIVEPELWWQVQRMRDRNKFKSDGTLIDRNGAQIRHVGSGFYKCYVCGRPVKAGEGSYKCVHHVNRVRTHIDRYVLACAILRLTLPDTFDLTRQDAGEEVEEIRSNLADARSRLAAVRRGYEQWLMGDGGSIDEEMYRSVSARLTERISGLERRLADMTTPVAPEIAKLLDEDSPVASLMRIHEISQLQHILYRIMDVTLHKHLEGKRYNEKTLASDVSIAWKLLPSAARTRMDTAARTKLATTILTALPWRDAFDGMDREGMAPWARDVLDEAPDFVWQAAFVCVNTLARTLAQELMTPDGVEFEPLTYGKVKADGTDDETAATISFVRAEGETTMGAIARRIQDVQTWN